MSHTYDDEHFFMSHTYDDDKHFFMSHTYDDELFFHEPYIR